MFSPLTCTLPKMGFGSAIVNHHTFNPFITRRAIREQLEHDTLITGEREQNAGTAIFEFKRKETEKILTTHYSQEGNKQKLDNLPPLVNAIRVSVDKNTVPFHFPGHKRGIAAPSSLVDIIGVAPFLHDATELPELDKFGYPTGPLLEAQKRAADLFGASQTWFLVCGTSCGILAAIMSACSPGDTLILARNSHVSATSAMVLCGAIPKYIIPEYNVQWDIAGGVTPSQVKMAIEEVGKEGKKAAAVFVTSPTYNGVCSNISEISQICHSHGIPLIVDEAHGAHFKFHPHMPKTALSQGADLVIQSTHKVLCSFSQSSMLHLSDTHRIDGDRLNKCLQSVQTTSPNWLLLASLDATRDQLSKNPNTLFNEVMKLVQQGTEQINNHIPGVSLLDLSSFSNNFSSMDPLRMTISAQKLGLSGFQAYDMLSISHGIEPELIGTESFTLAFGLGTNEEHMKRLINGLKYLLQEQREITKMKIDDGIELRVPFGAICNMSCTPREAFFARKKIVNLEESIGEICGEIISPFPPGIPVLIPGEIITTRAMDYLVHVRDQGAFLKGAADPLLRTVVVCDF